MADSVRRKSGADFGLGTTGNLGPTVLEGKAVGLVYVAVSSSDIKVAREFGFKGSRDEVKRAAALAAFELLLECVDG